MADINQVFLHFTCKSPKDFLNWSILKLLSYTFCSVTYENKKKKKKTWNVYWSCPCRIKRLSYLRGSVNMPVEWPSLYSLLGSYLCSSSRATTIGLNLLIGIFHPYQSVWISYTSASAAYGIIWDHKKQLHDLSFFFFFFVSAFFIIITREACKDVACLSVSTYNTIVRPETPRFKSSKWTPTQNIENSRDMKHKILFKITSLLYYLSCLKYSSRKFGPILLFPNNYTIF